MSPTDTVSEPADRENVIFDRPGGAFFRRADWLAFGTVSLLSFLLYFHTLAPTVTLEDSGELVVAADYLGVPHPPGYPIWTLTAWLFRWLFRWVRFYGTPESNWAIVSRSFCGLFAKGGAGGYPNPAFGVNLCSAFFGALACGLLALLISRSGADLLRGVESLTRGIGFRAESWFSWAGAVSAGLLLACTPVLWSQSVIAEVYSLNAFFQTLVLLLLYRWMSRPADVAPLYGLAFVFGLGLTNHQTLLFLGVAIAFAVALRDRALFGALFAIGAALGLIVVFNIVAARAGWERWLWTQGPFSTVSWAFWWQSALALAIPLVVASVMPRGGRAAAFTLGVFLGLSFYLYLPVASEQNPPMNWGYPRTWSGFLHVLSRGQYERIRPADIFSMKYVLQLGAFWRDLQRQFSLPIAALGVIPFLTLGRVRAGMRDWLAATLVGFVGVSLVFLTFQNPSLDLNTLFIARVQFVQSHAFWALWVGYGILIALAWLHYRAGGRRPLLYAGTALALALPVAPLWQNARDERLLRVYGGAEQNGHGFGWMFGHWQLEGVNAILREIAETERTAYPTPGYPAPLAPGAILFGGTDPGRFVPTYLIFSANVRPDVFLLTQNALADNHYLQHLRDLYGDRIWIPSAADSQAAFQRFYEETRGESARSDMAITHDEQHMSVEGVPGVMRINGYLTNMIFNANPDREFYIEVSYPIPWMTGRLEPHGLIFKLHREPVVLTDAIVTRDRAFWDWLTDRLLADPRYRRDAMARKTFSALRAAIASVYVHHGRHDDAEYALRQAIALHPLSIEANLRLAELHAQQGEFDAAHEAARAYAVQDPLNDKAARFAELMRLAALGATRLRELEKRMENGPLPIEDAVELTELYWRFQRLEEFDEALSSLLAQTGFPSRVYLALAQMALEAERPDELETALRRFLDLDPARPEVWLDLAAVQLARGRRAEAMDTLRAALRAAGDAVRQGLTQDSRFAPLRGDPEFERWLQRGNTVESGLRPPQR